MAFLRTRKSLAMVAPPPSPVATAKGSRSAAINDKIITDFLQNSLKVPQLVLPDSHSSGGISLRIPVEIDLTSLLSREKASVNQLLYAAADSGVFLLVGDGIPADELRLALAEADHVFGITEEDKRVLRIRNFGRNDYPGIRQEFRWVRSEKQAVEAILENHARAFSEKMESITNKLEMIAKNVGHILKDYVGKELDDLEGGSAEPFLLCLYKFSQDNMKAKHSSAESTSSHDLTLQFSDGDLEHGVRTHYGSLLSFNPGTGAIIVTIGKRIQEWSNNKFQSVICEPIFDPSIDGDPTFSLAFKCSLSILNQKVIAEVKTISIIDQLLIVIAILAMYNFIVCYYEKYNDV